MSLILTIIYGAFVGWLASLFMKTDAKQGAVANVVIGVIGSVIGRSIYGAFFDDPANSFIGNLLISVLGAALVIFIWQLVTRKPAA